MIIIIIKLIWKITINIWKSAVIKGQYTKLGVQRKVGVGGHLGIYGTGHRRSVKGRWGLKLLLLTWFLRSYKGNLLLFLLLYKQYGHYSQFHEQTAYIWRLKESAKIYVLPFQNACRLVCMLTFLPFSFSLWPALSPALTHPSCQLQSCGQTHAVCLHKATGQGKVHSTETEKEARGQEEVRTLVLQPWGQGLRLRRSSALVLSNFKVCVCSLVLYVVQHRRLCCRTTSVQSDTYAHTQVYVIAPLLYQLLTRSWSLGTTSGFADCYSDQQPQLWFVLDRMKSLIQKIWS